MFGKRIGVDLGTANVLVYVKGRGIVIAEPAVVAVAQRDNSIVAVGSEAIWERFCTALGRPDLASDLRFRTNPDRVHHRDALVELLQGIFAAKPTAHWRSVLDEAGVPNGPIYLLSDLFNDPQAKHRDMVVEVDHPRLGRLRQTGLPVRLRETPGSIRTPPPLLGEHTETILGELGYERSTIETFRLDQVV